MKLIRLALLGAVAFGSSAISARADELSALKTQIKALNARIVKLESTPARTMPARSAPTQKLLGFTVGSESAWAGLEKAADAPSSGRRIYSFSVLPTAEDSKCSTACITWAGQIRTFVGPRTVKSYDGTGNYVKETETNLSARGRIWVSALTETSVGDVGVKVRFTTNTGIRKNEEKTKMDIAWGYWQITPEWQLGGGYDSSLGEVPYTPDWQETFGPGFNFDPGRNDQMRVTYASGPLTWAVGIESRRNNDTKSTRTKFPILTSRVVYTADKFGIALSGLYEKNKGTMPNIWQVGGGMTYDTGPITITAAAAMGRDYSAPRRYQTVKSTDKYWGASVWTKTNFSDSTWMELSYGYRQDKYQNYGGLGASFKEKTQTIGAGAYWSPVSQLTVGLAGGYTRTKVSAGSDYKKLEGALVTWFNF